jgi:Xaa-Pro aminopeptidase
MLESDMGETRNSRISRIQETIRENEAIVLAGKSVVGWIFGIRRKNASESKAVVPNCIALINKHEKPVVFCDLKLEAVSEEFDFVDVSRFEKITQNLKQPVINCDFADTPAYFPLTLQKSGHTIRQATVHYGQFEATKNPIEVSNLKEAAKLTSLAFIKALAYVENAEKTTEIEVSDVFETELRKNEMFVDLSFNVISSFGANTSIVHYNPKTFENAEIAADGLFLFDAGAHFKNSTTDMTRVVYRGECPPQEFKRIYTTILKSVVMYTLAKFPNNTKSYCLDSIARYLVWRNGFDYPFGTGHGVGSFGLVHEHPRISRTSPEEITANMVITIEPGIYDKTFGIRLENMLLTKHSEEFDGFIEFETMNFIPYCLKLIERDMLDKSEIKAINAYSAITYEKLHRYFENDPVALKWLINNTKEL